MTHRFLFSLPLCLMACAAQANPLDRPGFDFLWEDQFDGTSLDTTRWEAINRRDSHNEEKQYYRPEQVTVGNGNLVITATDEPLSTKAYRSGLVRTLEEQAYGRWEVRANLPTTQGMWPAIWLLPNTVDWPTGGEIDIMENRGSEPWKTSSAYHWGDSWPSSYVTGDYTAPAANFHEQFHTYAVEWEPDEIRYYVDDNLHFIVHESVAPISSTPMTLIMNIAVGGWFGGDPDGSTVFPQTMEVDYVRVWELDLPEQPPTVTGNNLMPASSFEAGEGGLNSWTKFGGGSNVTTTSNASFLGEQALSISGQDVAYTNYSGVSQGIAVEPGQRIQASSYAYIPSLDSLLSSENIVTMKLEFYSVFGGQFDSSEMVSYIETTIADNTSNLDTWLFHTLETVVPIGAVETRLAFVFVQENGASGKVYIDDALIQILSDALPGDANADGEVNLLDLSILASHFGGEGHWADGDFNSDEKVDLLDLSLLASNFAQSAGLPEPASAISLCLLAGLSRRNSASV